MILAEATQTRYATVNSPRFQTAPPATAQTATGSTVSSEVIPNPPAMTPAATTPAIEVVSPGPSAASGGDNGTTYLDYGPWYKRTGVKLFLGGLAVGGVLTALGAYFKR